MQFKVRHLFDSSLSHLCKQLKTFQTFLTTARLLTIRPENKHFSRWNAVT